MKASHIPSLIARNFAGMRSRRRTDSDSAIVLKMPGDVLMFYSIIRVAYEHDSAARTWTTLSIRRMSGDIDATTATLSV